MVRVRIYCGDDSVEITLSKEEYRKLKNFINRQDNMQIFEIR